MSNKSYLDMYACIYIYIQNTLYFISIDGRLLPFFSSLYLHPFLMYAEYLMISSFLSVLPHSSAENCFLLAGYTQAYFYQEHGHLLSGNENLIEKFPSFLIPRREKSDHYVCTRKAV